MNHLPTKNKFFAGWIPLTALLIFLGMGIARAAETEAPLEQDFDSMPALEMAERALVDTLYYNFDPWFPRFKSRIKKLEARPATLANQMELMRFYFYMAGLCGELTHVLAFNSSYSVEKVRMDFMYYSGKAREQAETLLDIPELSREIRADAYYYLGMSEGYMGVLEYGQGHYVSALLDGWSADNHLEDALELNPDHADAHVGLGVYRYGNTRLGGLGNFLMQGGEDMRAVGLRHLETALEKQIMSRPLAIKNLIWFYISEQINPDNADLPDSDPLSRTAARSRSLHFLDQYERLYFKDVPEGFIGNMGLAMMWAIQFIMDGDYTHALEQFERNKKICDYLIDVRKFKINPQYLDTVKASMKFSRLMMAANEAGQESPPKVCAQVNEQIKVIDDGGSIIHYESSKLREEMQGVFHRHLKQVSSRLDC